MAIISLRALALALSLASVHAAPTAQNGLTSICNFGENPTNLVLQLYEPPTVAAKPAIILAVR